MHLEDDTWATMTDARRDHPDFDLTRSWKLPPVPVEPGDENFGAYLTRAGFSVAQLQYTRRSFSNATGDALAHMSAAAMLEQFADKSAGEGDFRILDGYSRIHEHLADGLDIRLNTHVEVIEWRRGYVRVHAGNTLFEGERALITLPLGVLQADKVRFIPDLPASKRHAIQVLRMGPGFKLIYRFDQRVAPAGIMAIYSATNPPMWWSPSSGHNTSLHVWTAFATGDWARELLALGEDGALQAGLDTLRRELKRPELQPVAMQMVNWADDPFALGAYSVTPPGGVSAHADLGKPVDDTLYWAGEATAKIAWTATVHGALDTGQRAAREILADTQSLAFP